ncbi:MAG: nodulation protein NfeD [Actinomycetota bacterium]|nr:nodulation protein NfeD [Actinomycetota bacterium]
MVRYLVITGRLLVVLGVLFMLRAGEAMAGSGEQPAGDPHVLVTRVDTAITPVVADHIATGLRRAASEGFDAYVIELDTPGGLLTSMRDIVEHVLASPVPVIVYVSPAGARAGSAGAIITFAAHVSLMAPGTAIGAATPVGLDGVEASDKVVNDAAAQAEALAQLRGRNVQFAVDAVREGRSAAVDEAVRLGVVDAKAASLSGALVAADGRTTTVASDKRVTARTADATVKRYDLGVFRSILQALADPNIAFLLLTLGTLGLIYELAAPGVGVAGATGATALLLALFSLSVLPVNVVGLLLLAVAAGLFAAELFAPGVAGFAFGGAVVLVLAAIFLFDDAQGVAVDLGVVLPTAVVVAVAAVVAGRVAARTRGMPSTSTGADVFAGRLVTVREANGTTGSSFTEGAWWSIRSIGPPLRAGGLARIASVDELVLVVEPLDPEEPPEHESSDHGRDEK